MMRSAGRVSIALFLLSLNVGCLEDSGRPCNGCYSPHPYTQMWGGGTTYSLEGTVTIGDGSRILTYRCGDNATCVRTKSVIEVRTDLPTRWLDGGSDADAQADANEPPLVAVIDLGRRPIVHSSALVGARIIVCSTRDDALSWAPDGGARTSGSRGRGRRKSGTDRPKVLLRTDDLRSGAPKLLVALLSRRHRHDVSCEAEGTERPNNLRPFSIRQVVIHEHRIEGL